MSQNLLGDKVTKKTARRKTRKRTKAQIEADRRLAALRKNLAREIELDFDKFAGDSPSAAAGLFVMTRLRIILAFLQAFFPMFISAPRPRRVTKKASQPKKRTRRGRRLEKTPKRKARPSAPQKTRKAAAARPKVRVVKLEQEKASSGECAAAASDAQSNAQCSSAENTTQDGVRKGKTQAYTPCVNDTVGSAVS